MCPTLLFIIKSHNLFCAILKLHRCKDNLYIDHVYASSKDIHSKQLGLSLKGGCKSLTIIIDKFGNKNSCALNEKGEIICCDEF